MQVVLTAFFLTMHIFFAILILYLCISFLTGGPFVPSSRYSTQSMVDVAGIKPGMVVYDLGSGDGRLLLAAAKKGAKAVGIEINPFLVFWSKTRAFFSPYRTQIHVRWQNFWKTDISDADVVFIYLLPWRMHSLKELLMKQAKKGTLIISNSFIFPKWKILRKDTAAHTYVFQV